MGGVKGSFNSNFNLLNWRSNIDTSASESQLQVPFLLVLLFTLIVSCLFRLMFSFQVNSVQTLNSTVYSLYSMSSLDNFSSFFASSSVDQRLDFVFFFRTIRHESSVFLMNFLELECTWLHCLRLPSHSRTTVSQEETRFSFFISVLSVNSQRRWRK
jgi:hypothetical protein